MYGEHAQTSRRLLAAAASLAANGGLIVALLWGLTSRGDESAIKHEAALTTVEFRPEPRPKQPPPKEPAANFDDRSAGQIGKTSPISELPVLLPPPIKSAPPVAGDGLTTGSGNVGPGAGSGSGGEEDGSGGAGFGSPPVRITGTLRDSDYPREAQTSQLAGTVGISFRVRTDGKVDHCIIERSSEHALLDDLTCRLFTQRYRFRPATNAAGEPIEAVLRTSFTWGMRPRR
ncbi:MAG: TonB family protein [Tsuneonella sp.]